MRPYTRSLHPDDYLYLPHAAWLQEFANAMLKENIPHREWHTHRLWEYASILQQLEQLNVPRDVEIVDVGAGGSFFDPYLAMAYPKLCCTDSMYGGDVTATVDAQRRRYNVALPLFKLQLEDMSPRPDIGWGISDDKFDVTMCISVIEHVKDHDAAFRELVKITKPGGYIFLTSDYFNDKLQWERSPWRDSQLTLYTKEYVLSLPERFGVQFVGPLWSDEPHDLDYRGDFVETYSFVNICLRRLPYHE